MCDTLRSAGLEVWLDQSDLRGGDAWDASIRDQIRRCAVFVPVISSNTQGRAEGYFRLEWKLAVDRSYLMAEDRAFFFPVVTDETSEREARVPDRIRQFQWTRITDDASRDAFARRLRKAVSTSKNTAGAGAGSDSSAIPQTTSEEMPDSTKSRADGFWVAVLPFRFHGADPDLEPLAEGFAEDIVVGLSRFSYLRVMGRDTTRTAGSATGDAREQGHELGARYMMTGSLRRGGASLRVSVRLVDVESGISLWAEHYDRPFSPESVFELQDELVPRIVSTVADVSGVLARSLNQAVEGLSAEELDPYEAVLSSFAYFWRVTSAAFNRARDGLLKAIETAPTYADAWAMLAVICGQAHGQGFAPEIDYLSQAEAAARKAVDLAPSNHFAYFGLAQVLFFKKEFESFRNAALRAATLNPMDGNSIAFMGELLVYANEREKGEEFAARAKQLNPHYPGWYWYTDFYLAFQQGNYREALSHVLRVNMPGHWGYHLFRAAACGHLGQLKEARQALQATDQVKPGFLQTVREDLGKWFESGYVERIMEGLDKARPEKTSGS